MAVLIATAAGSVAIEFTTPEFRSISAWLLLIAGTALVSHVVVRLGAFVELERLLLLPLRHLQSLDRLDWGKRDGTAPPDPGGLAGALGEPPGSGGAEEARGG